LRDLGLVHSPVQLVIVADNLRLGGAIRGSVEPSGGKGRGECCGYSEVFYVDPVNLVVCLSTDVWLNHTTSMTVLGEKLRRVLWTAQLG
jgi:hypothetical protein